VTRRLLNLLTALSLLLCVAACVLWVRSYLRPESATWPYPNGPRVFGQTTFQSLRGALHVSRFTMVGAAAHSGGGSPKLGLVEWRGAGRIDTWNAVLPYWPVALSLSLLPAVRLLLWIWEVVTRDPTRCRVCGYDLRATPDRCPECGMPVSPAAERTIRPRPRAPQFVRPNPPGPAHVDGPCTYHNSR